MTLGFLKYQIVRRFISMQDGAGTIFALFLFVITGMIGALGLDYTRLISARTELQVAADLAAHGALYYVDEKSNDHATAKMRAIQLVETGMPNSDFGNVLTTDDIHFGIWDYDTLTFTVDETSRTAVMVTTSRLSSKTNAVSSFLFRLVGLDSVDVTTEAVFTTYRPWCMREGIVGDDIVDMQSNNTFTTGFCIHSNEHVELNSGNVFQDGTHVSMPNENDLVLPTSGFESNSGLYSALQSGAYRLRIVNRIQSIITGLANGDAEYVPEYIKNTTLKRLSGKHFTDSDFTPGNMYYIPCNGKAFIQGFAPIREVVIMTSCEMKFGEGTVLEDVIVTNTSIGAQSFNAPASFQVGRDDNCAEGGGAQLVTMGSVDFAADFRAFGGQVIAKDNIYFAANADGIQGVSLIAGGTVSGTSNMVMGFCGGAGMEGNFEAEYFRLAG